MKRRAIASVGLLFAIALTAAVAAGATPGTTKANKLTVWLQVDAQTSWPDVVGAATKQFESDHPGWSVDVQYQNWGDHLQKFDATLAGGGGPDVIEMGNTEMTKYMAAGAFADLELPEVVLRQLGELAEGAGEVRELRRQALRRPVLRGLARRHLPYRPVQAGGDDGGAVQPRPVRDAGQEGRGEDDQEGLLAGLHRRHGLVRRDELRLRLRRPDRRDVEGQVGRHAEPARGAQGLQAYKDFFLATSRAGKTSDETHPNPYDVYAQGQAGSMLGPAWFSCCVGKQFTETTGQFPMPSHERGKVMPGFLGGSDLGVPITSKSVGMAADWIKAFTSTSSEKALQAKGNIPNATNLLGTSVNERAAVRSWFVPTAKHWVDVENGNILRTMLAQILTGKLTVKQAATVASDNITRTLNQS